MPNIERASNLLDPGKFAIVLFTEGQYLTINSDGSGESGKWKMDPDRHFDKVIIYGVTERTPREAAIYVADYVSTAPSPDRGRFVIRFRGGRQVGTTRRNWKEFAGGSTNPIRYLSK